MTTTDASIEVQVLRKIQMLETTIEKINLEISKELMRKSSELKIKLTQDLKEKCSNYITGPEKAYACKFCNKSFDEGRKLGGHVSRAHKKHG